MRIGVRVMFGFLALGSALVGAGEAWAGEVRSDDAVVRWTADTVEIETSAVAHRLERRDGGLKRTAWVNRKTGVDLLGGMAVEDFAVVVDDERITSVDPGWKAAEPVCRRESHGELHLELTLEREGLRVRRHYVAHPGLSLVRAWLEVTNAGEGEVTLSDPPICAVTHRAASLDLKWMSGAECFGDSWRMRTERLGAESRHFDSYDAPQGGAAPPGDGVDVKIVVNDRQAFPAEGWAYSAHGGDVGAHEVATEMKAGDRVLFVLGRHGSMGWDTTEWDPVVTYEDGEAFRASAGFSAAQGQGGWGYGYLSDAGEYTDMVYDKEPGRYGERWRLKLGVTEPFVSATEMHPDPGGHAVRVFTAPRDGQVTLTGSFRNTGNGGPAGRGFRTGTMAYAPWFCLMDREAGEAAYVGFDYMGHWLADLRADGTPTADLRVGGYRRALSPGETVRTPYSFTGLFRQDLDDMGGEILDWQYQYLWDYTREPWFPAVRMLGYWWKGTKWGTHGWVGGEADMESAFRKVFRLADFMREVGGDTYHRDWGWWDRAGDWNGPDFRATGEYLRQHGMGQLIYAFIYTVDGDSSVAQAHPEWLIGGTLDQSQGEVVEYEVKLLDEFYRRWGPYQWRNDSTPIAPRGADDTPLLGQQQGFMEVLRRFLDEHPDCAFQGVNGGGMALNWEYLGLASGFQFTDGQSQALANYYASYLFPPDKVNNMPDIWDPDKYDPATWRALLCSNFDTSGDSFDPEKVEGFRDVIDVYHYLQSREVVGRWARIYHPIVTGDDETMYLQRMSRDRRRGIIITKHRIEGAANVRPKGLLAEEEYEVGFHDSAETFRRSGARLMAGGIDLTDPAPGELIYLNLPDHPGNRIDRTPPERPSRVTSRAAVNMGVPGVEVMWEPGKDDHWLSYYQVLRDGRAIGKAAKGCFYFDHSAGADPAARYEVVAVDGSGNRSTAASTPASDAARREVLDDADTTGITYEGAWQHETDFGPAHLGTLSTATEAGAAFTVRFRGRSVTWHSRLGAEGGIAAVSVDGEAPVEVSCYTADEIPGWPAFGREWEEEGEHVLRVEVTGKADPRGAGTRVWVDGVAVGR